jgi:CheY-like chemotaxis protein
VRSFVVLVVDDDRATRDAAVGALSKDGYRVLAAHSGGEAMALLERHPGIDLLITEVVMPGIGGFMLADMATVRRPDIRVLYTTAAPEIAALKVGRLRGALLVKPVDLAALRDAVHRALDGPMPEPATPAAATSPPSPSLGY